MRKLLEIYDELVDFYNNNKTKFILIGLSAVIVISIGTTIIVTSINNKYEKELIELKKERIVISKKNTSKNDKNKDLDKKLGKLSENKVKSELKNLDLSNIYSRDEIKVHAELFLNINGEESRQKASTELPIVSDARKGILKSSKGFRELNDLETDIKFIGIDYAENPKNYTATVLADRNGSLQDGSPIKTQVSLLIHYSGTRINDWEWKENEQ